MSLRGELHEKKRKKSSALPKNVRKLIITSIHLWKSNIKLWKEQEKNQTSKKYIDTFELYRNVLKIWLPRFLMFS